MPYIKRKKFKWIITVYKDIEKNHITVLYQHWNEIPEGNKERKIKTGDYLQIKYKLFMGKPKREENWTFKQK